MWFILLSLALLTGDVLSQAHNFIDSETDLLVVPSQQLLHSSADEDLFPELPFGAKLPGYEKPLFAYSYTVGSDEGSNTKLVGVQLPNLQKQSEKYQLTGLVQTDSTKNVIYLNSFNIPKRVVTNDENSTQKKENGKFPISLLENNNESEEDASNIREYLPPKEISAPPRELSEYLPPKEVSAPPREISEYLPPNELSKPVRELSEYLPPKEISSPPRELSEYLPPKEVSSPPSELSEYLPPKEVSAPSREISEYLPPNELSEPVRELSEYLPPNVLSEPVRELSEYLPPAEISVPPRELSEYLPPKEAPEPSLEYLLPLRESKPSEVSTEYLPPLNNSEPLRELSLSEISKTQNSLALDYLPPQPAKIRGVLTKHPDSSVSLFVREQTTTSASNSENKFVTENVILPKETILFHLVPPFKNPMETLHTDSSQEKFKGPLTPISDHELYFPPNIEFNTLPSKNIREPDLIRDISLSSSVTGNANTFPVSKPSNPVVAKAETAKLEPYSLIHEIKDSPIKAQAAKNKVDPQVVETDYSIQFKNEENPLRGETTDKLNFNSVVPTHSVYFPPNNVLSPFSSHLNEPLAVLSENKYPESTTAAGNIYISPAALPTEFENNPIVGKTENPQLDPYALVHEVRDLPIKITSEKNKLDPYALVHEVKDLPIKIASEKNKLDPYALVHELRDIPIKTASEKNKLVPYALVHEVKDVPVKIASEKNKLDPYALVHEVKDVPVKIASEKNKLDPYALVHEVRDVPIKTISEKNKIDPYALVHEVRDGPIKTPSEKNKLPPYALVHEVRDVPIKIASKKNKLDPYSLVSGGNVLKQHNIENYYRNPTRSTEKIQCEPCTTPNKLVAYSHTEDRTRNKVEPKVSSSVQPLAVVADKIDSNVFPVRSASNILPHATVDEYQTLSLKPGVFGNKISQYGVSVETRETPFSPGQHRQRVNPLGVSSRIVNRPIIPQTASSKPLLAAVASNNDNSVRHPLNIYSKQSNHVIGENSYGCLSNDECKEVQICDRGRCILACSIAKDLCIGDARCEARHHVPACVCPLMSTARTVSRAGFVQFDCIAMAMPSDNAIQRTQTKPANRYNSFSYSRPIVSSPIRGSIRDTAGAPAPPSSFGSGSSSFAISGSGDACNPSPCGPNTRCSTNTNGIALCRCIDDYVPDGNTINGCKPQCVTDSECPDDYLCSRQKCERVCARGACGHNANCDGRNHRAICTCPSGYQGNPNVGGSCSPIAPVIRVPDDLPIDVCNPNPCGLNADCRERGDRPVCSCPRGYEGDPLTRCNKGECVEHDDCPNHLACQNLKCFDPCVGVCGSASECTVRNHQPICSCPRNFIGDPFTSCRQLTEHDICNPTPCGLNTKCSVRHDRASGSMRAVCSCIDNYLGNPLSECRPECVRDTDCSANQHCRENRCRNPCIDACGEGAYCDVRNNRAVCTCPEHFSGDPHSRCYPECTKHDDCPDYQACYLFKCIDPCQGACGTGADCKVEKHTPICSCPRGYTGDPFVSCRAFTLEDLCRDNPCGTNAECHPGKDRTGNDRPVCTCPRAYIGNPLVSCQRGECESHNDCPDHEACYAYMCQSPCYTEVGSVCGNNADCKVRNHTPVCSCPRGYTGNPLTDCSVAPNARIAGHHRQQRKK